jgi:hypothetical protein
VLFIVFHEFPQLCFVVVFVGKCYIVVVLLCCCMESRLVDKRVLCCCCGLFVASEPNGLCSHCARFCAGFLLRDAKCKTVEALDEFKR